MRPITKEDLYEKTTQRINPGPGAHQFQELNPEGKYFVSKFHNSGSKIWNPKTSQRFYKSSTDAPGSGTYHPAFNDMSDSGKYVLSKYKGAGKRKFDFEARDSFVHKPAKETKSTLYTNAQLLALELTGFLLILGNMTKCCRDLTIQITNDQYFYIFVQINLDKKLKAKYRSITVINVKIFILPRP